MTNWLIPFIAICIAILCFIAAVKNIDIFGLGMAALSVCYLVVGIFGRRRMV